MFNKIKEYLEIIKFRKKWRKNNLHNKTTAFRPFPIDRVSVGKGSYGSIEVYSWGNENEKLSIGSYCSIASFVKFILGGNHDYETISTYPFHVWILGQHAETKTNGKIIIEDDVWIGQNSTLLSGVRVGQGAVVGANSVVTKNVPPYSIVGGNPAKIIKYRFNDEIINCLMKLDYSRITDDFFSRNQELFEEKVTIDTAKKIVEAYKTEINLKSHLMGV